MFENEDGTQDKVLEKEVRSEKVKPMMGLRPLREAGGSVESLPTADCRPGGDPPGHDPDDETSVVCDLSPGRGDPH
eukprot:10347515-Heterocapsa_arctica.AAC.1